MKRIAVLTSGGDAPGMNACLRSVVRSSVYRGLDIYGVMKGYEGLIKGDIVKMNARSVSNILGKGGTILKTARSKEFMGPKGRAKAYRSLKKHKIDGLIVIGGNGSFKGAHAFYKEHKLKIIGVPGTIDNDVAYSDYTIGCSTALNTALDAIDKVRDTVTSMERIYIVEVMGRKEPFLGIRVALAGGAEDVLYPGLEFDLDDMCDDIRKGRAKGKISWIIVVSEGAAKAHDIADVVGEKTGYEVRSIVLGHVQRGGCPDAFDRILASRMGAKAVEALIAGETDKMVGIKSHTMQLVPLKKACDETCEEEELDKEFYKLIKVLSV